MIKTTHEKFLLTKNEVILNIIGFSYIKNGYYLTSIKDNEINVLSLFHIFCQQITTYINSTTIMIVVRHPRILSNFMLQDDGPISRNKLS